VPDHQERPAFFPGAAGVLLLAVCAAAVVWTGILPGWPSSMAKDEAVIYRAAPAVAAPVVAEPASVSVAVNR
jgi:hypothetical protein